MWMWLVDGWTKGRSWTCSIPILAPLLFSPVSHPKIIFFYVLVIASCSVWTNFQGNKSGHWIINHSVMHAVQRKDEEVEDTDISCYCTKEYFWCLLHLDHVVASIQDSTKLTIIYGTRIMFRKKCNMHPSSHNIIGTCWTFISIICFINYLHHLAYSFRQPNAFSNTTSTCSKYVIIDS